MSCISQSSGYATLQINLDLVSIDVHTNHINDVTYFIKTILKQNNIKYCTKKITFKQ